MSKTTLKSPQRTQNGALAPQAQDWSITDMNFEIRLYILKNERLTFKIQERSQVLEDLKKQNEVIKQQRREKQFGMSLKSAEFLDKSKMEKDEGLRQDAKMERLKEEYAELEERKQELLRQVERFAVCKDFMERVNKLTKFKDLTGLQIHIETLFDVKENLCHKENCAQDQVDMQKKTQVALEDQYKLMVLQGNCELSQLNTELEKTRLEVRSWDKEWQKIKTEAAEDTLRNGHIKMAIINQYELTGAIIGENDVNLQDTQKQLDYTKMFLMDYCTIMKQSYKDKAMKRRPQNV